jgi:hypothetical protein
MGLESSLALRCGHFKAKKRPLIYQQTAHNQSGQNGDDKYSGHRTSVAVLQPDTSLIELSWLTCNGVSRKTARVAVEYEKDPDVLVRWDSSVPRPLAA